MKKIGNISSKSHGFVFVDRNDDGMYSPWEARTTVSSNGNFQLDGSKPALTGVLVHAGGVDAYSGTENNVYYKAPSSSKVMNALTTVTVKAREDMASLALERWEASQEGALKGNGFGTQPKKPPHVSYTDAAQKLLSAFETGKFAIFKQDAFAMLSSGQLKGGSVKQLQALKALKLDLKLELLLDLGSSVLNGIDLTPASQYAAQEGMVQAVVDKVIYGQKIDFNEVTHISDAILSGGVTAGTFSSFEAAPFGYIYGMSTVIAELMAYIDGYVDSVMAKGKSVTATDVQNMLGKLKHVFATAHDAEMEIERAWLEGGNLDVLLQYTGDGLRELLGGASIDPSAVLSRIGRDDVSMTTGDDIWVVKPGVPGEFAVQKIAVSGAILSGHEFVLELSEGVRIEVGPLELGAGLTALESLAQALDAAASGVRISVQGSELLLEYENSGRVNAQAELHQGVVATTGGEEEVEVWMPIASYTASVVRGGVNEVASFSPANMEGYDRLLNFSTFSDRLDLPVTEVMSVGVYGNVQIGARGIVTAVVDPEDRGAMSTMELGEIVDSILVAMGSSKVTAAFRMDGNTYVVQGDGLAGMQDSDVLIELTGVQLQDLPSILI